MKKKLIAVVLSVTVIAGVGTIVYKTIKDTSNVEITEINTEVVNDVNSSEEIEATNEKTDVANNVEDKDSTANKIQEENSVDKLDVVNPAAPLVKESPVTPPAEENSVTPPVTENQVTPPVENKQDEQTVNGEFMAEVEQAIFNMVNEERVKVGVAILSYNNTMQKYARIKSQDMGERGYFDHANPEGELITAQMQRDGVTYSAWGENIAYIGGVSDANTLATQFMNNWMNSDGHRKNILSTNFSGIGVGVCKVGNKVYATQEFYR